MGEGTAGSPGYLRVLLLHLRNSCVLKYRAFEISYAGRVDGE